MPRAGLTRALVLETAVRVVDRDGLAALSMRRLGDELGVEAMSLYRHVAHKSDLLDGVFEALLGEVRAPTPRGRLEDDLRAHARAFHRMLRAHPNAALLFATRPAVTRASLAYVDTALGILRGAGFSPKQSISAFQSLVAFVVGCVLGEGGAREAADAGPPRVDYAALPASRFPHLTAVRGALATHHGADDFAFGLDVFVRGLAELARATRG